MHHVVRDFALVLSVFFCVVINAPAADDVDRINKLITSCLACHGSENFKTDPTYSVPRIGQQRAKYIVTALKAYKNRERKNPLMTSLVSNLSEADMAALGDYFGQEDAIRKSNFALPIPPVTHPAKVALLCGSCHGETGLTNMPEYPVIAHQYEDYLIHALNDYRNGNRKHSFMPIIANDLSPADIKELAAYYAAQASPRTLTTPAAPTTQKVNDVINSIEMVDIRGGEFAMGVDANNQDFIMGRPQHRVVIRDFRIGQYSVTFAQYDAFARATRRKLPSDEGWGRNDRPVINVSWADIQAFIAWLNLTSGKHYRLPTEAEREYVAGAGATTTNHWWGDKTDAEYLNAKGMKGRDHWIFTAPVGQFLPNPWGVYDMAGNVWERTADCWHPNYVGAPSDGSAWQQKDVSDKCFSHVIRGGYFDTPGLATYVRSRASAADAFSGSGLGFRLAEDK